MQGKYKQIVRVAERPLRSALENGHSVLLMGPRQTGKTTLVEKVLSDRKNTVEYLLQNPTVKQEIERDPGKIIRQIEARTENKRDAESCPIVFVDEAQKVPSVFDAAQYLIDKQLAQFILTGSSARKLRRKEANLLPGRVKRFFLDPLLWSELGISRENTISEIAVTGDNHSIGYDLSDMLAFGMLPKVVGMDVSDREGFLRTYAEIYLEEEIRAEALSRKIGAFSRFLEMAANESGTSPNLTKLSNESGVSVPSIKAYYQVLEDTLVMERVDPFLRNARKRILASPRYYFFDTGVRNALARLPISRDLAKTQKGILFEHSVVLEIRRRIRLLGKPYRTFYWRTSGGAEVDCVLDMGSEVIPIEIKASFSVSPSEIRGIAHFLDDYKDIAKRGFVVFLGKEKEQLAKNITAVPWDMI